MYLFPTEEELGALWREISPRERFLRAARQAVDYACSPDGDSMAAFFLDSQDFDIREEEGVTTLHVGPPRFMEYSRGTDTVNFRGWDFSVPDPYDYSGIDLGEKVSWDEI